jgi:hypothetical protein
VTAVDQAATVADAPARPARLLTAPFTAWLGAATVAAVGDGILYFAIGWTASSYGGRTAGVLLSLVLLPRTLLMLLGGAIADRWGLRRTVILCDACMIAVLVAYLAVARTSLPAVVLLGGLSLALGVVSAFRLPAAGALPRLFVVDTLLPRAMSLTGSMLQVARIVGPPLGGVVIAAMSMTGAISATALTCVVLLVVMLAVRPPHERPPEPDGRSTLGRIREGLVAARRIPAAVPLLAAVGLVAASLLPLLTLSVPLAARERGWSASATGTVEAAWIVGTLSVSLVIARTGTRARPLLPLVAGPFLAAGGVVVIAVSAGPSSALVGAVVMGVGTAVFTGHVFPLYVLKTPAHLLGRLQALLGVVQSAAMLAGNPLLGLVAGSGGAGASMLLAAALSCAAGLLLWASPSVRNA